MSKINLTIPTRQSPKGLVIILVMSLRKAITQVWPALVAILFTGKKFFDHPWALPLAIGIPLVLLVVHSILYYLNFYFYIQDDEFILKKGYLNKKTLSIPLGRIQNINTKQNLLQQFLSVSSLELDTAGSAVKELKIHALEQNYVKELYEQLSLKKDDSLEVELDSEIDTKEPVRVPELKTILQLSWTDLFKIGISRNHLKAGLVILFFVWQFFDQVTESLNIDQEGYYNDAQNYLLSSGLVFVLFMVVILILLGLLFSLVDTFLKYFELRLSKSDRAYQLQSGLLNRKNALVPFNKIQEIEWITNPLMRLLGLFQVKVGQASSAEIKTKQQVIIPGCTASHIQNIKDDIFGTDQPDGGEKYYTDKYYIRRLWMFWGWLPLTASPFLILQNQWFWAVIPVWLVLTLTMAVVHVKKRYFQISTEQIMTSRGTFGHKWTQIELFRLQNIEYKQSVFQKRKKLASLQIYTASGSFSVPFINENLARELYNFLLYKIESTDRHWM